MTLTRLFLVASLALSAVACGTRLKAATQDQIGCPADEIEIKDHHVGWSAETFTAMCHSKRHYCSRIGTGRGAYQITCSPEKESPPPKVAAGGCQNDSQCKGDRVCEAGACVNPKPR